nr:RecName: Full=Fibrinolytic enzyme; AltName: Full=CMase [Cordyceps militaris]
IVGGVSVAIE